MKALTFLLAAGLSFAAESEAKIRKEYLKLVNETEELDVKKAQLINKWLAFCKAQDKVLEGKASGSPGCVPPRAPQAPPQAPEPADKK